MTTVPDVELKLPSVIIYSIIYVFLLAIMCLIQLDFSVTIALFVECQLFCDNSVVYVIVSHECLSSNCFTMI